MKLTPEPKQTVNPLRAKAVAQADAGDGQGPIKIWQEPKRKRAYFRALKRGEHWAIWKKTMNDFMNNCARAMFAEALVPSPFLKMLGLGEQMEKERK